MAIHVVSHRHLYSRLQTGGNKIFFTIFVYTFRWILKCWARRPSSLNAVAIIFGQRINSDRWEIPGRSLFDLSADIIRWYFCGWFYSRRSPSDFDHVFIWRNFWLTHFYYFPRNSLLVARIIISFYGRFYVGIKQIRRPLLVSVPPPHEYSGGAWRHDLADQQQKWDFS